MYYGLANDSQLNVLKSAYTRNRNIKDEKILCDYWLDDGSFLKIDASTSGIRSTCGNGRVISSLRNFT